MKKLFELFYVILIDFRLLNLKVYFIFLHHITFFTLSNLVVEQLGSKRLQIHTLTSYLGLLEYHNNSYKVRKYVIVDWPRPVPDFSKRG